MPLLVIIIGANAIALYATLVMEESPYTYFCSNFNDDPYSY